MDTITLGLEWFLNPDHIPFFVAEERGYYDDAGVELDVWEPDEHYDTLEMLEDGELDVAITEPIHLVEERAAGTAVSGIAEVLRTQGGIMYPTNRGWETPADLPEGVRLNYPGAPSEEGRRMVADMVQTAGGSLTAGDIEPVDRGFYHTDAIADGDADIAFLAFYNFEIVEATHRGIDASLWELADYGVPDFNRLVLAAADDRLDSGSDAIERFLSATHRGLVDTVEDGETAAELFFERHPGVRDEDPELMAAIAEDTLDRFVTDMRQDRGMYRALGEWCVDLGVVDEAPPVESLVAESLLSKP
jgi:ABC-type nitrate/sulfonate/bicarbonate transport system substrate-binding protein